MHKDSYAKITPLAAKRFVGRLSRPVLTNDVVKRKSGKLLCRERCNTNSHHLPSWSSPQPSLPLARCCMFLGVGWKEAGWHRLTSMTSKPGQQNTARLSAT